jgi:hypothetical protein
LAEISLYYARINKTSVFAFSVAMGINFGRIFRLIQVDPSYLRLILLYYVGIVKDHGSLLRRSWENYAFVRTKVQIFLNYV